MLNERTKKRKAVPESGDEEDRDENEAGKDEKGGLQERVEKKKSSVEEQNQEGRGERAGRNSRERMIHALSRHGPDTRKERRKKERKKGKGTEQARATVSDWRSRAGATRRRRSERTPAVGPPSPLLLSRD
jgi:hypothetical protein